MGCTHTEYEASKAAEIYAGIGGCFLCLEAELAALRKVAEALEYTLPMAKGYATEHPVGNNAGMIISAEQTLAALRAVEGKEGE